MTATRSKGDLRTAALAARDALDDTARMRAAQAIAARGLPFALDTGAVVAGYVPIRSELDPTPLMLALAALGAQLALPVALARGHSLSFRAWAPDDKLVLGS
ncbi:MAG: 5-formyltetrahydrofolate cyclo-ligase, partial [Bradyrhizobium sp.]